MTPDEIKAALKSAGLSQLAIARRTGYSPPYVYEVIQGTRDNRAIKRAVARAIGRPIAEVFPARGAEAARAA